MKQTNWGKYKRMTQNSHRKAKYQQIRSQCMGNCSSELVSLRSDWVLGKRIIAIKSHPCPNCGLAVILTVLPRLTGIRKFLYHFAFLEHRTWAGRQLK